MQIWKYVMPGQDAIFKMPAGAQVVSLDIVVGDLVFWAEVCPELDFEERRFKVFNTGVEIPDRLAYGPEPGMVLELPKYISTVISVNGTVWHLYEMSRHD